MKNEKTRGAPAARALEYKNALPVVPLRDVVVFPRVVISLYVGRPMSLEAIKKAQKDGGRVFLVTQKSPETDKPGAKDVFEVGCVASVLQMMQISDGTVKVLVEGSSRARARVSVSEAGVLSAETSPLPTVNKPGKADCEALRREFRRRIEAYEKINPKAGEELLTKMKEVDDMERLIDHIASFFPLDIKRRQRLLETTDLSERATELLTVLDRETEVQKIERRIRGRIKNQMEKNHREYYLQEQARAIQRELGDDQNSEMDNIKERMRKAGLSKQGREKCEQEIRKLKMMPPMSAEATVTRSYLDAVLSLPWRKRTNVSINPEKARSVLDSDHYGLDKIKERILEHLAVQKRVPNGKAPILCFVGPPGVGKTSLGRSIAAATGRVFGRISLGGVRDEAEIRGHRRTYVGSMPGKIAGAMTRAGVKNPVILLDEIDKMGYDFRGDPSSALLEVLDPEQNSSFVDHYIEIDFDLSEVMFVTTANTLHIPPALSDRLEIVRLSGYTESERINIARRHLVPRQFKENGMSPGEAEFEDDAVRDMIRYYTREAGVRKLERNISQVCRKIILKIERDASKASKVAAKDEKGAKPKRARKTAANKAVKEAVKTAKPAAESAIRVTPESLEEYLGVRKYRFGVSPSESRVGQVTGLVWTASGGDLLSVESCKFSGRGKILRTGTLGKVLQESVDAAFSAVRSFCDDYDIESKSDANESGGADASDVWQKSDFHIHLPEGAIPKDGPSAGIGIATAILSTVSNIPVCSDVAMTGEITLRGEVLPVGGIKEKLLAAARGGIRRVILPEENKKDLAEIQDEVKDAFEICTVKSAREVFELALTKMPPPKKPVKAEGRKIPKRKKAEGAPPLMH